jgi:uncharacterized repeat protein (TIGR01451 family)
MPITDVACPGGACPTGPIPINVVYSPDGRFAAIPNTGDNTVTVYSVDQTTGAFTPIGLPFPTGSAPELAAYSPDGRFAAVANIVDNTVSVYSVNQLTGVFTPIVAVPCPLGACPTGTAPFQVVYSPDSRFAAVTNLLDNTVGVYSVDQVTGALTPLADSPYATGNTPRGLAYSPNGKFAAVANFDPDSDGMFTVSVYKVNTGAGLSIIKSGLPKPAIAGNTITYTLAISNNGPCDAQNVVLTDAIPANTTFVSEVQTSGPLFSCSTPSVGGTGVVSCTIPTFAVGASATFTITVKVNSNTPSGTVITNTATIASATTTPTSSTDTTEVATSSGLTIVKTGPHKVVAGKQLTYTISITNNGPSDAQNVVLTDTIPANTTFISEVQTSGPLFSCSTPSVGGTGVVTCTIPTFAVGASAIFTITVKVNSNTSSGTTITNTATIASATTTPTSSTDTAEVATSSGLKIVKTGPHKVVAGKKLTYTVHITNNGPSDAQDVVFIDSLPHHTTFLSETQVSGPHFTCTTPAVGNRGLVKCTIPTLAVGASAEFKITVKVHSGTPPGSFIKNTGTITSATTSPLSSQVKTKVITSADLAIVKTGPEKAIAGDTITYTLHIINKGPSKAHKVVVTDSLPHHTTFVSETQVSGPHFTCSTPSAEDTGVVTCTIPSFAAGARAKFKITVKVNAHTKDDVLILNKSKITSSTADPDQENNHSNVRTRVSHSPIPPVPSAPPIANPDSATTTSGTPVVIPVLDNDIPSPDCPGVPLVIANVTQPLHGMAVINDGTTVTYTPNKDFIGTDIFTYKIAQGPCSTRSQRLSDTRAQGPDNTSSSTVVVSVQPRLCSSAFFKLVHEKYCSK